MLPAARSEPPDCHLVLPPVVWTTPGREVAIYFENITLAPYARRFVFDVACEHGGQWEAVWRAQPDGEASYPWRVEVRDLDDHVLATGTTTVRVARREAGAGRSIRLLMIGDSITHASVYPAELLRLCAEPGNPSLTLVGTHRPAQAAEGVVHEGYGGWSWQRFYTRYAPNADQTTNQRTSPFVFKDGDGPPRFDFARYVREKLGGQPPDFITIFLGPNDVFPLTDATRESGIAAILETADKMLADIRTAVPHAPIGLVTPIPPASQDGFGANYGSAQNHWTYRKSQHRLVSELIRRYAGREDERLYVVPAYVGFDTTHGYPVTTSPASARMETKTPRQSNALHPLDAGYRQIADAIYGWLKNML